MESTTAVSSAEPGGAAWAPVSLADLVGRLVDHHRIPVPVDRRLRGGALAGLLSVGVLTVVVGAGSGLANDGRPGVFLFGWQVLRVVLWGQPQTSVLLGAGIAAVTLGALGAVVTGGFGHVRPSLLGAVFALVLLGCAAAVPLLVAGMVLVANLAAWAAFGVLCMLAVAGVILVFLV